MRFLCNKNYTALDYMKAHPMGFGGEVERGAFLFYREVGVTHCKGIKLYGKIRVKFDFPFWNDL